MNNFVIFCICVVWAVAIIKCNGDYIADNNIIQNLIDAIDISQNNVHSRQRRDQKTVSQSKQTSSKSNATTSSKLDNSRLYLPCCKTEPTTPIKINPIYVEECYNTTFTKPIFRKTYTKREDLNTTEYKQDLKAYEKATTCYIQCIAEKHKLVNGDGMFQFDVIIKFILASLKDTWVAPLLKPFVTKCSKEVYQEHTTFIKNKTPNACNPTIAPFFKCLYREMIIHCPPENIQNPEACARFKLYTENKNEKSNKY